ncbi:MAG: hypothetical protein ACOC2H_07355, partial [Spirochaetota bacterium]
SVEQIDRRAQEYYEQKKFARAIAEWIRALEQDPDNIEIQQKIEMVYEKKREKDLALQKSKKFLREATAALDEDKPEEGRELTEDAIQHFVIAYRIDPMDTDLILMRDRLSRTQKKAKLEIEKKRLNEQKRREYEQYHERAVALMDEKKFEESIEYWDRMLSIFPDDEAAVQGKRRANLALQSRLKFEQIQRLMASGITNFDSEEYITAQSEFNEVMKLDPGNPEARDYLARIDSLLEEQDREEQKRIQAERYYHSGLTNTEENRFNEARDDFESVLALIDNYKDTVSRLEKLDELEKEYREQMRLRNLERINEQFQRGLLYLSQAQYTESIAAFQNVLDIDSGNTQAQKYIRTAKEALAEERKDVVDEESPYYELVQSLIESGKKYYDEGEYQKSLQQWERILNLFPSNTVATEYLLQCQFKINPDIYRRFAKEQIDEGKKLLSQRNYTRARRKFEIIKNISPDYPGIDSLIEQSTPKERIVIPQTASAPPPSERTERVPAAVIEQRYNRALQNYSNGNLDAALADFRWVVNNDSQNVRAIININKIESQMRLSAADTAGERRDTLTAEEKTLVRQYYFNGITYYSRNQFPEAIAEWRKVLTIDPDHKKAKNNIRKCLLLMQQ